MGPAPKLMGHQFNRRVVGTLVGALISCSAAASPHAPAAGASLLLAWGVAGAAVVVAVAMGVSAYRMCTRMRAALAAAEATEARFAQATRHSRTVVWEVTVDGLYTFVSPAAKDVLGYAPEDLVGKKYVWDLHPEDGREALRDEALRGMKARESFVGYPNEMMRADGKVITVATSAFPIYHPDGSLHCYRGTDTDITEKIEAEAAALENLTQLRHAMDATSDGIWDWNLLTGEIHLTSRVYTMLGYEPGEYQLNSQPSHRLALMGGSVL